MPYSNDFTEFSGGTRLAGYLSPDGSNNAYKISHSGGVTYSYNPTNTRTTDTRTIWARTVTGTGLIHLCSFNGNSNNLFTITEEWQRFQVIGYTSVGADAFYAADFRGSSTLTEIIVWGAQAENIAGANATSNIFTDGASETRFADVVSINTSTISGTITSITETIGGVDQTPITTIPATYTIPTGNINKITME